MDSLERYKHCVELELSKISMPVEAAVCNEPESCGHHHDIQEYLDAICGALLRSGKLCLRKGSSRGTSKLGWNDDPKKSKRQARNDFLNGNVLVSLEMVNYTKQCRILE